MLAGLDPFAYLEEKDLGRSILMSALIRRVSELREKERERLAFLIRKEVVTAWNEGQKK